MSLQRLEQNGPYEVANQSPVFLHVGHLTALGTLISCENLRFEIQNTIASPFSLKGSRGGEMSGAAQIVTGS